MSEDDKTRAAAQGIKFSEFAEISSQEGNPMQVVGLRDGDNVRADLTTDLVDTNPAVTFRSEDGRFKSAKAYESLTNQLKVNRYLAEQVEKQAEVDKALQDQIDELAEHHKEPVPEPAREPIYAEQAPTEYPAQPPEPLQADDQWYEVTDPDFDYDKPDPEGLNLYIWTKVGDDFEWVLFESDEIEYATLEHSDTRDNLLQAEIEELTLVVGDALQASQQEHGAWKYSGDGLATYPRSEGEFTLASNNLGGTIENNVVFNTTDLDGQVHGFGDIEVGEYLEIVDEEHPEQYALWVVDAEPVINGVLAEIKVKLKKAGKEGFDLDDRCQVRFIQIQESDLDLAELDERYAGKEAERLNISHQAENTGWYNAPHKLGIVPANIQTEIWYGNAYHRMKQAGQEGLLAFTTKSPSATSNITWKSWSQLSEGQLLYLRNTDSRLDNVALKKMAAEDIGSVIVMKQPSTGAELSLHVRSTNAKTADSWSEHGTYVQIRRKRGAPTEDGEWRLYLQKEYLSAKGHDHYVGRLNSREDRKLVKWASLGSGQFSLSEATGNPSNGDGCYSWSRGRWFKVYSGAFSKSTISGDYGNGLGIVTIQKGNTIYCGYLTVSDCYNYNGDHTWRTQSFMGNYENAPITEWDETFIVSTNGLIQNSLTEYKDTTYSNVYALGSPDEDIENPERPIWTGDNFGDFKSLNEFVAELKSADPEGSSIEFLMEQWQTYWYTPGR